ncbi:hexitol phosphatase HxpB [Vibrio viridaestus]|nr:hexitol phosphatase HxpB [Vibrio viridaestus]
MKSFKAVIFDMDGVLIDSEPLWQQAQIETMAKLGITITVEQCIAKTMGKRIDAIASIWCREFSINADVKQLENAILDRICQLIQSQGDMLPGVTEILQFLLQNQLKIGLATSSSIRVVDAVLSKLQIKSYFSVIRSADLEPYGKPHPSVYLSTAQQLGVSPADCLVIEDSLTGLIAAKAASMTTYIVNHNCCADKFSFSDNQFDDLHQVLAFLTQS